MVNKDVMEVQEVNIRKVFKSKNPKLARWIPGFVFRYLEKVLCQETTNEILRKHHDKNGLDFVHANIKDFNVNIIVKGDENLPKEGRFIFAANHPLGGFDGLVILSVISRYYKSYKFLVNDILMNLNNLKELFIPVNKHGRQDQEAAEELDRTFKSDTQMLTFPAGLVSRKIKGQIIDLPWQKNFITKAKQYQRDVVPVHISGNNTKFFYRLASFRKALGIKANIEMLYLVDETYKHRNKTLTVTFGKPIPWQTFDKSKRPIVWAKWVKDKVYELAGVTNVPF